MEPIHSITAKASVTVDDGSSYNTTAFYQDPQRVIFQLTYPDRQNTVGIEGKYYWQHNGEREEEGSPFIQEFALGHQFFAQLLYFDQIHPDVSSASRDTLGDVICQSVTGSGRVSPWKIYINNVGKPLAAELLLEGASNIMMILEDWKEQSEILLPHKITIDDGQRVFTYLFTDIDFNYGAISDFYLPMDKMTDEQQLLRLHRIGMDDHFFERIEGLQSVRDTSFLLANRGEVSEISQEEFDFAMGSIMNSRDHDKYDDMIRPIVKVSDDGSLGWVIVQVEVHGVMTEVPGENDPSFNFQSAWIELYEKKDGVWKMTGNVSNFK